ncbi:probable salivary secreted peptide [Nilaparvata lugens]|uniref:probable salivary secreted peptide n=1 Tax=Nilaparvata lugens TaxID=108931 RepID=UPI00193E6AF8|nr:probable salivary secreted peptide [Nilaparvata lugens]
MYATSPKIVLLASALLSALLVIDGYQSEILVQPNGQKSHNLIIGHPRPGDSLLFDLNVYVPRKLFRIVEKEIKFPSHGSYNNKYITSVQCWDGKTDGTGAFVTLRSGGLGAKNVTILFKSQRSHGIHHSVKIYGSYYRK